jgi:hypothetical protein
MGNDDSFAVLAEEVRYLRGHFDTIVQRIEERNAAFLEQERQRYTDMLKVVNELDKKVLVITVLMIVALGDRLVSTLGPSLLRFLTGLTGGG